MRVLEVIRVLWGLALLHVLWVPFLIVGATTAWWSLLVLWNWQFPMLRFWSILLDGLSRIYRSTWTPHHLILAVNRPLLLAHYRLVVWWSKTRLKSASFFILSTQLWSWSVFSLNFIVSFLLQFLLTIEKTISPCHLDLLVKEGIWDWSLIDSQLELSILDYQFP